MDSGKSTEPHRLAPRAVLHGGEVGSLIPSSLSRKPRENAAFAPRKRASDPSVGPTEVLTSLAATPAPSHARARSACSSSFRSFRPSSLPSSAVVPSLMIQPNASSDLSTPIFESSGEMSMDIGSGSDDSNLRRAGQKAERKAVLCSSGCCDDDSVHDATAKFAKLKSPSKVKDRVQPTRMTGLEAFQFAPPGTLTNFTNGTSMTKDELKKVKLEQRSSQNLYCTSVYFPTSQARAKLTDDDRTARSSLLAAKGYICEGNYGCTDGDCMKCFETSDVLSFRQQVMNCRGNAGNLTMNEYLHQQLAQHYNRSDMVWSKLTVHLDEITSTNICPAAFGLLSGASSSQLQSAAALIMQGHLPTKQSAVLNKMQRNEQRSLHFSLLRAYVAELVNKHEMNPAPGAYQPDKLTTMNKTTMKAKWAACIKYFADAPNGTPGSKSMLRRAWKLETRLKEKRACSHSKCVLCSDLCSRNERLNGVKGEAAKLERTFIHRSMVEHEGKHLASRMELDQAGLQATVDPHHMWTLVADAATQRNFLLPKFQFRTPKDLARRPFWSYKLMATYAYGYGFTPFLVHDSQNMGANLTWTVIWLTLCSMRDRFGFWPAVLHLTLDNTTGENKNEVLLAMCAWLVSSGKVKQVRVLFLMVGHTHIIIDQIFGVITVGLRRKELLVPEDLVRNIESTLAENSQYMAKPVQTLSCLWDFTAWVKSHMGFDSKIERLFKGNIQDERGVYSGMYDLLFKQNTGEGTMALMQYREHVSFPWLPEASLGAEVISTLPLQPPGFQQVKSYQQWACSGTMNVRDTISISLKYARTAVSSGGCADVLKLWDTHFQSVPNSIELLQAALRLEFRHFDNDDVLRLTGTTGATGTTENVEEDIEKQYKEWQRNNVDVRTAPMAIDPVVSSAQSKTEYEKAKAALQAALRVSIGPSISVQSAMFLGDFVLLRLAQDQGITLGSIQTISNQHSPFSANLTATAVLYDHKPNAQVSGLFGTFFQAVVLAGSKRQQVRKQVHRDNVIVFNATLAKSKHLSLTTLRVLALALPDEYPVPLQRDIPETHLDDKDQRESRRAQRSVSRKSKSKPRSASVKPKRRPQHAAESDSSEESTDDSSSEEDEEESDSSDEIEEADDDGGEPLDADPDQEMPQGAQSTGVPPTVPVPPPAQRVPEPDTVVLFNMYMDPQYMHMKYPVGLAMVLKDDPVTEEGQFRVAWFALPPTQLAAPERRSGTPRAFKETNVNLTFQKVWIKHNWWTDKRKRPSIEQIMNEWYTSLAMADWLLPVSLPQPTADDVKAKDQFKITMEFVHNTLIPACENAKCVHQPK